MLACASCAVALGAAGWLLLGPLWTLAWAVPGYFVPMVAYGVGIAFFSPSPATLIAKGRPQDALRQLLREETSARRTARAWPSQFAEELARNLLVKSDAQHAMHYDRQALSSADESVAVYQTLAAGKPAKYAASLARALHSQSHRMADVGQVAEAIGATQTSIRLSRNLAIAEPDENLPVVAAALTCMAGWLAEIEKTAEALEAAHEATELYWRKAPSPDMTAGAVRAALLEGRLLCQEARYHESAKVLARGWTLAASRRRDDDLGTAAPTLRTAYRADPDDFTAVWLAETGAAPPGWLATA
jgi:tetratricopeptide (TPR) repeat protein